jgi:hypothetical protein
MKKHVHISIYEYIHDKHIHIGDALKKQSIITPLTTRLESDTGVRTDEMSRTLRRGAVKSYADCDDDEEEEEEEEEEEVESD